MKLKTVDIKGKEYVTVNERIRAFRSLEKFKGYSMDTEVLRIDDNECVMKSTIRNETGTIVASGIAHESKNSSFINKTSHIENCETSAWGRALGNLGIGIDNSVASYEEVSNAISTQENNKRNIVDKEESKKIELIEYIKENTSEEPKLSWLKKQLVSLGTKHIKDLSVLQLTTIYNKIYSSINKTA